MSGVGPAADDAGTRTCCRSSTGGQTTRKKIAIGPRTSVEKNQFHADRLRVRAYPAESSAMLNHSEVTVTESAGSGIPERYQPGVGPASAFATSAAPVIRAAIPAKIDPWNGRTANQYRRPVKPRGKKIARCS